MLEDVTAGEENIASSEVGHIYDNNGNDKSNLDGSSQPFQRLSDL